MRKWVLCLIMAVTLTGIGCHVVKDVLKTVAISKKINAVNESETPIETLKALKELVEEVR